MGQFEVRFFLS